MKTRKVLWLTCVMTCLFVGRSTADETPGRKAGLPRYVSEFLYKLQIRAELISDPIFLNQSVPSAAAKIGLENVHQAAAEAKDGLTGSNYFKIRTIPEGIVIEKHYTLIDDVRELRLYLFTDASGHYVRAGYSEGIR